MMSTIFPCVDVDKQVTALETGASETPNFVTFSTQNGNCVEGDQHFDSLRAKIKSNERVDSLQLQIRHDKWFFVQRPTSDAPTPMDHPLHWPLDAENKWNVSAIFFLEIFRAVQSAIVSHHSQLGVHGLTRPTSAISAKLFIDRPPFQRLHGPPDEMRLSNKNTRKAQAQKKWTRAPTPSSIIYRVPLHGNGGATFPLCCIFQTKGKWPHRRAVLALVHGHRSQLKCRLEVAKNVQQVADDVRSTNGAIATLCKSRSSSYKRKCVTWIFDTQTRWKFHWRLFTCTSTASQIFSCTDHHLRDVLNFWKFLDQLAARVRIQLFTIQVEQIY